MFDAIFLEPQQTKLQTVATRLFGGASTSRERREIMLTSESLALTKASVRTD
jgi:hypothetical protein